MFLFILLIPNIRTTPSYLDREDKGRSFTGASPRLEYTLLFTQKIKSHYHHLPRRCYDGK